MAQCMAKTNACLQDGGPAHISSPHQSSSGGCCGGRCGGRNCCMVAAGSTSVRQAGGPASAADALVHTANVGYASAYRYGSQPEDIYAHSQCNSRATSRACPRSKANMYTLVPYEGCWAGCMQLAPSSGSCCHVAEQLRLGMSTALCLAWYGTWSELMQVSILGSTTRAQMQRQVVDLKQ